MASGDMQDLVSQALGRNNSPQHCWAYNAPQEVLDFVEALWVVEDETPGKVNRTEARRIIKREWDLDLTKGQFNRHFRKECTTCGRE